MRIKRLVLLALLVSAALIPSTADATCWFCSDNSGTWVCIEVVCP